MESSYDPASDRVFTFNAGSKDATAIDTETGKAAGTVKLGGKPESATWPVAPGQMLVVEGTANNDTIYITPGRLNGDILVSINGVTSGPFHPTSRIVVMGYGGDDTIQVSDRVKMPVWLAGGTGNDTLIAGRGPSVLLGGAGNDTLVAGRGDNLMIGGTGSDTLYGNRDSVQVAGSTSFDANPSSLEAILNEWDSNRAYTARVQNLMALPNKTSAKRLNGENFLTPDTIQDDGATDLVYGEPNKDLSFVILNGPTRDWLIAGANAARNSFAPLGQTT